MDRVEEARRLRAMRELAGHRSPGALAKAMAKAGYPTGFKYGTIKNWENEDHDQRIPPEKLEKVAEVCEIPPEFFYADLGQVAKISPTEQERIQARFADAAARGKQRRAGKPAARPAPGKAGRQQ